MEKHQTKIGKNLIEILMYSMYDDAKVVLREYVQNAYDAINEAVDQGILKEPKDGSVNITLNRKDRIVRINDNGTGILRKDAARKLLDIADSFKDGKNTAGHYGIGRLTGLRFCERLIFKTSAMGENECTQVILDSNAAYEILNNPDDHRSAEDVVNAISTVIIEKEEEKEHYFEIEMENISTDYSQLLEEDFVREYLEEVAPIDYSTTFKNMLVKPAKISSDIKAMRDNLKYIQLSINNTVDIRKRYGITVEGTGDKIEALEYFDISDKEYGFLAWGWYAVTAFTKNIPISDKNRGIRLRKKNIQVGTADILNKYFNETRGNNYFYGEIFAVNNQLRPNSERTALVPTPEAYRFYELLKVKFKELHNLYHLANELKTGLKDVVFARRQASTGNEDDIEVAKTKLSEGLKKIEKAGNKSKNICSASKVVTEIYKDDANRIAESFEHNTTYTNATQTPNGNDNKQASSILAEKQLKQSATAASVVDIFAPLKEKYEIEDVKLIRRIFASFTKNCPVANRALLEELKKKAIKELSNG